MSQYRCAVCTHTWDNPKEGCECCQNTHCSGCGQVLNLPGSPLYNASNPVCFCCPDCELFPCECEDKPMPEQAGFRAQPPWELRDEPIFITESDCEFSNWKEAWPILADRKWLDPCQVAADFYLLEGISSGVINVDHACDTKDNGRCSICKYGFTWHSDELKMIRHEAETMYQELIAKLDPVFQAYVEMACGGELRHHPCFGNRVVSGHRRTAWANWRTVREKVGDQALLDMQDMFSDWKGGGFGGKKWGDAAKLLYDRVQGKMTAAMWCDRVFTLVHNGGVFLNKLDWEVLNRKHWDLGSLQSRVLPAHGTNGWNILLGVASPPVYKLWDENWVAMNKARIRAGAKPTPNPRTFKRVRKMCMHCHSNPLRGHMVGCFLYTSGMLPLSKDDERDNCYILEEDDWHRHRWTVWELPEYDVDPNGVYMPTLQSQFTLRLMVSKGYHTYDREWTKTLGDILSMQWKASNIGKEVRAAMAETPGPITWSVFLGHPYSYNQVGQVSGQVGNEKFSKLILDMGLVVPQIEGVDWSKATEQFMASLSV